MGYGETNDRRFGQSVSKSRGTPRNVRQSSGVKMHYSVFKTDTDFHVGYVNHRNEFVSLSVCWTYEAAQSHADKLNAGLIAQEQRQRSTGNRYMRRFVGR